MPYLTECLSSLVAQTIGAGPARDRRGRRRLHRRQRRASWTGSREQYPDAVTRDPPGQLGRPGRAEQPGPGRWPPAGTSSSSAPTTTSAPRRWSGWSPRADELRLRRGASARWSASTAATSTRTLYAGRPRPTSTCSTRRCRGRWPTPSCSAASWWRGTALRFPEDLPVGSDQPFTLEACVRARRISVLADYTYYYAVRRDDAQQHHLPGRPSGAGCGARRAIMDYAAGLIPSRARGATPSCAGTSPGSSPSSLGDDFLALDRETRQRDLRGIGRSWRTPTSPTTCATRLDVEAAGPRSASPGAAPWTSSLAAIAARGGARRCRPFLLEGDRAFAPLPGLPRRRDRSRRPWYEVSRDGPGRLADGTKLASAAWEQDGDGSPSPWWSRVGVTGDTDLGRSSARPGACRRAPTSPAPARCPRTTSARRRSASSPGARRRRRPASG